MEGPGDPSLNFEAATPAASPGLSQEEDLNWPLTASPHAFYLHPNTELYEPPHHSLHETDGDLSLVTTESSSADHAAEMAPHISAVSPPRKRPASFTTFLSRILPSNRPEQGGTHRDKDATGDTDSAYNELGMNPNELTAWNVAKDKDTRPGLAPLTSIQEPGHRRVQSWHDQRGGRPRPNSSHAQVVPARPVQDPTAPPSLSTRKSEVLTRAEISALLKSKEESRRHRRDLVESGDWLGVQGADPYSGQFSVLTPMDSVSSDKTPVSTRNRLSDLAKKKLATKLQLEELTLLEEEERARARKQKEQTKLRKIERVKDDLRMQQQDFAKWSQHKRQWSSAAEPRLSPVAQSLSSVATNHNANGMAVPNFSRPSVAPAATRKTTQDTTEPLASEPSQRGRQGHRRDQSTDTIIHKTPSVDTQDRQYLAVPTATASSKEVATMRSKGQKHFLWRRRRRATDPGEVTRGPATGLLTASAANNIVSSSLENLATDHFSDLTIPDHRLHLSSPDPADLPQHQQQTSDLVPHALTSMTNLHQPKAEQYHASQSTAGVTATSSQSRLRGLMKHSIPRKLVPSRSTSVQTRDTQQQQKTHNSNISQVWGHTNKDLSGDTLLSQSQHQHEDLQQTTSSEGTRTGLHRMTTRTEEVRGESAFIPITITTGCVLDQQSQDVAQLPSTLQNDLAMRLTDTVEAPAPLLCSHSASNPTTGESRAPSHPTTTQNASPSLEHARKTAETGTASRRPPTPEPWRALEKLPTKTTQLTPASQGCLVPQAKRENKVGKGTLKPPVEHERSRLSGSGSGRGRKMTVSTSPSRGLQDEKSQQARQRHSPGEDQEAMIQEAARIAVLRSRAKAVLSGSPPRTPSPSMQRTGREPASSPKSTPPGEKVPGADNADTGVLSRLKSLRRGSGRRQEKDRGDQRPKADAVMVVKHACMTVYMIALGLLCAWWIMVQPAFDQQSQLWTRRRKQQSTWQDVGVFVSAGVFSFVGAVCGWYSLRVVWWIAQR
ncbi:hypothetical protein F4780DRAFT_164469 [Xylariomycetidae sp. FL0641]|nr:hypothetical protein F4780DRAFT_164469 [Xylariomycetidae sp. FL0641]